MCAATDAGAWKMTVSGAYAAKRMIDIVGNLAGLLLLSPVFIAIALAVKLTSPGRRSCSTSQR